MSRTMIDCELDSRLLLRPAEAARALGISPKTLWSRTVPRGDVPCVRVGKSVRYAPEDLRAWVASQREC